MMEKDTSLLFGATTAVLSALALLVVSIYLYFTRNFGFWKKYGIPYVKPTPFVGNLGKVFFQRIDIGNHLKDLYLAHRDKPYVGIFSFDTPALIVNNVDLMKNVLVKDFQNFTDRVVKPDVSLDPMFAKTMFSMKGQEWKHVRSHLTPTFTTGKMKSMFYLVEKCAQDLGQYLDNATARGDKEVPTKEVMSRYTTDSITTCAFGLESNSLKNPDSEFRRYLRTFVEYSVVKGTATLFLFFAPTLQNFFKLKFVDKDTTDFLRRTVWGTVDYREKSGVNRKDFIDHMMEMRKKNDTTTFDNQIKIEGDTFVAQSFGFFFAGFETSGTTMTYTLYELALQPDLQTRLRKEMKTVLSQHDHQITYTSLQEMTYLDMVVSETLRKYPVLPFLDRVCLRDYQLPGPDGKGTVTLKAGTGVYIPMLGLQMDPEYFPDPEKYDPERFTEENKAKRPGYTYFPFGEGPRICIGKRFGLMQVKTGLAHLLTRYEVAPCKNTPTHLKYDPRSFLLSNVGDMPLSFKRLPD